MTHVNWVDERGLQEIPTEDLKERLARADGFVWIDYPKMTDHVKRLFIDTFGFDEEAVDACSKLSVIPRLKGYGDHVALTVHSLDAQGHLLEMDQFIGSNYLVIVHSAAPGVSQDAVFTETSMLRDRIRDGYRPRSPIELAVAAIGAIASNLEERLSQLALQVGALDRRMREKKIDDRWAFLDELNEVKHHLLTVFNRASQTREVLERVTSVGTPILGGEISAFDPLAKRFDSISTMCQNEREFAKGVLEHYESVLQTKMNSSMQRLAGIAYLLIPFTVATGLLGMQISAADGLNVVALVVSMVLVAFATWLIYLYTRRKGWW